MPKLVVTFTREDFRTARSNDLVAEVGKEFLPLSGRAALMKKRGFPSARAARRPEHGLIPFPETQSALSVVGRNGVPRALWACAGDMSGPAWPADNGHTHQTRTSDYILERISIGSMEKQQVVETFGEPYLFFFGEHVQVLRGAGYLINTIDFPWLTEWLYNWDNELRGTRLTEHDARAYLKVGTTVYEGYFAECDYTQVSADEYKVPFNFTFLVSSVIDVARVYAENWEANYVDDEIIYPEDVTTASKVQSLISKAVKGAVGVAFKDALNPKQLARDLVMSQAEVAFDALSAIELRAGKGNDKFTAAQILGLDSRGDAGALSLGTVMYRGGQLAGKITHLAKTGDLKGGLSMGIGTTGDILTGMATGKNGFDTPGGALVSILSAVY